MIIVLTLFGSSFVAFAVKLTDLCSYFRKIRLRWCSFLTHCMLILMVLSLVPMLCEIILHPSILALVYHPLVLLRFHRLMIMSLLILRPFLRMTHLALVLVLVLILVLVLVLVLLLAPVFLLFRLTLLLTQCDVFLYAKLLALIIYVQRCFFPFANK